jgi:signal peptidase I
MHPTLQPGDRLLVDPRAFRARLPAVGEVVVLTDPADPGRWLVKRVAAVGPGEFWATPTGYLRRESSGPSSVPPADSIESMTLAERSVYVVGDFRERSRDSRQFGAVRVETLRGHAYRCYYPPDRRRDL